MAPLRRAEWVVYAKPPFGGPAAVLAYLARYTHRVAISSNRLVSLDDRVVRFRWKDYRRANPATGAVKMATMTLAPAEFIRRFLIHVLPSGFHRIRHYGLLAKGPNTVPLETLRALILERTPHPAAVHEATPEPPSPRPPRLWSAHAAASCGSSRSSAAAAPGAPAHSRRCGATAHEPGCDDRPRLFPPLPPALAQDPLRLASSPASSAVLPPPMSAPRTARGPTCWTFWAPSGHRPDLLGHRQHRSDKRYRHSLTRPGR